MADIARIRSLWHDLESDLAERKESLSDRRKIAEAICAHSNDIQNRGLSGFVMVGLADDGSCANLAITDDVLLTLASMRDQGQILPIPRMAVEKVDLDGCTFAVVEVWPHPNPPVRFDGRTWIRVGPRRAIASVDEERILSERQRSNVRSFDQTTAPGASIADISQSRFRDEYLPQAISRETLGSDHRNAYEQLRSLRFIANDDNPNIAAAMAFADDPRQFVPGDYIQFVRYDGLGVTDPILDQKEIDGPLSEMLLTIDDLIKSNITTAVEFGGLSKERPEPQYSFAAIQQIVRNAVMHRNYETSNSPIRLYWFRDRIEIHSPGGLFGQVNEANFGKAGITDYRNPLLAEVMKTLGFVQRFGVGISTAFQASRNNGSPDPQFEFSGAAIVAIMRSK